MAFEHDNVSFRADALSADIGQLGRNLWVIGAENLVAHELDDSGTLALKLGQPSAKTLEVGLTLSDCCR
ncbi:hypothetical protein ATE59_11475 [Sphingopyxis sp. A083]|nr:hypothetical protein ATE59_11475 [Sphingopyxis sp. A083]